MGYRYAILGGGRQGAAAAYDLGRFGEADLIVIYDLEPKIAEKTAERINKLLSRGLAEAEGLDVRERGRLKAALQESDFDAALSAVPYSLNLQITEAAIEARVPLCDLGGSTETVLEQLKLGEEAGHEGISIIPDCGLAPGTANVLAAYAISLMERHGAKPQDVKIYCGGLPQDPRPPLDYQLLFSIEGLLNEYLSPVHVLREGRVQTLEPLTELEIIEFPEPLGECEAFLTSGGTSAAPWRLAGLLRSYEYKTVRYKGHCEKLRAIRDLGLLAEEPTAVGDVRISPRELFKAAAGPRLDLKGPDIVVLRVICKGELRGESMEIQLDLLDFYDEETGFTAMERTTGFSAGVVMQLLACGEAAVGVHTPDEALPIERYIEALLERGFRITETLRRPASAE